MAKELEFFLNIFNVLLAGFNVHVRGHTYYLDFKSFPDFRYSPQVIQCTRCGYFFTLGHSEMFTAIVIKNQGEKTLLKSYKNYTKTSVKYS